MKEWTIKSDRLSITLLIDKVTILQGSVDKWKNEIDLLYRSFTKNNPVIQESNQRLVVQDYRFSIISYSPLYNSDSYTLSKSKVEDLFFAFLELSPIYKQFVETWEELQEDVLMLIEQISIPVEFELQDYKKEIVKKKLVTISHPTSSLESLTNEIKMINSMYKNKKNIFLILAPENHLTKSELEDLVVYLNKQNFQVIIVTTVTLDQTINFKYNNKVLNEVILDKQSNKIASLLPFIWNNSIFAEAKNLYTKLVDNSHEKTVLLSYGTVDNIEIYIYIFLLLYLTKIPFRLDTTGISEQYQTYIDSIINSRV